MAVLGKLAGSGIFGIAGLLGNALFGKSSTPLPTPLPTPTRDDARAAIAGDDEVRKRRGAAADILYGAEGAGAPTVTGKLVLGA